MTVVDLGAAPGSWSQVLRERLGPTGKIVAIDLLPMDGIAGVTFIQGDFREEEGLRALIERSRQIAAGPCGLRHGPQSLGHRCGGSGTQCASG